MKKILYFLIAVVFFASACEEDDNILRYELGTEFLVSVGDITSLDDNVTVSIANNEKNLTEIAVSLVEGASLGTITLSDGEGSTVLSAANLGVSDIEDAADLQFDATFDGKAIVRYRSLEVDDPISVETPGIAHTDSAYAFLFAVEPVSATVTSTTVETKLFKDGTYDDATIVKGADGEMDSVFFSGVDYSVGDTIYVRITANTATKEAVTETYMVVEPYSYKNVADFTLDASYNAFYSPNDTLAFDMILSRAILVAEAADSADIKMNFQFADLGGSLLIELFSNENMEFVKVAVDDAAETYANADVLSIEATDFAAAVSSVEVEADDVLIYRTRRGTGEYSYGILKVLSTNMPEGGLVEDATIEIEYKYNEAE